MLKQCTRIRQIFGIRLQSARIKDEFSLLAVLIVFYQDPQRIKQEARRVYAMGAAELYDTAISSHQDVSAHPAKMYHGQRPDTVHVTR